MKEYSQKGFWSKAFYVHAYGAGLVGGGLVNLFNRMTGAEHRHPNADELRRVEKSDRDTGLAFTAGMLGVLLTNFLISRPLALGIIAGALVLDAVGVSGNGAFGVIKDGYNHERQFNAKPKPSV